MDRVVDMTICFCVNIWNHHQGPVARELAKLLGSDDFRLFVFQPLDCDWSRERINMGWNLIPPNESWIVGPPKTTKDLKDGFFQGWIESADVLIYGENMYFDHKALARRLKAGKLSFKVGERLCKTPIVWRDWLNPKFWRKWLWIHNNLNHLSLHFLTMSYWCADDLRFFRACKNRIWRWGYLTDVSTFPVEKKIREKIRIGWCGRLIWWKKVCDIIRAISLLNDSDKACIEVVIVGDGPKRESLIKLSHVLGLDRIVVFKPFFSQKKAIEFMESVDIFPFTSNRLEGWGAILPEAMDKCCAVVASEDAGSTLELVKDGENGFTFKSGDIETLSRRISTLVNDKELRRRFGLAAWRTMQRWAPFEGAKQLINLSESLLSNNVPSVDSGLLCGHKG